MPYFRGMGYTSLGPLGDWTQQIPTEPGFYWLKLPDRDRHDEGLDEVIVHDVTVAEVFWGEQMLGAPDWKLVPCLEANFLGDEEASLCSGIVGWWLGPITPPRVPDFKAIEDKLANIGHNNPFWADMDKGPW